MVRVIRQYGVIRDIPRMSVVVMIVMPVVMAMVLMIAMFVPVRMPGMGMAVAGMRAVGMHALGARYGDLARSAAACHAHHTTSRSLICMPVPPFG
ncbi:hypothetical protein ACLBX0_00095 [Methylobacterium brachiatum]